MHECSRQRLRGLMQEFRKHQRGVLSASSGRGHALQKIVEYSYGLRGQRKWAFHRAYNLAMHHNTVTGPPWPAAEYDERFGWKAEVKGQLMVMQTASPLPLPLLEHLHEMMVTRPRAERRMYESVVHVPHTPLVQDTPPPPEGCAALSHARHESLGVSLGKADFSIVEVKQNRRSKARFKRKTKIDRKFLTNADLVGVCKSFGRGDNNDSGSTGQVHSAADKGCETISVRAQLKDALEQLRKAREELRQFRAAEPSALPPPALGAMESLNFSSGIQTGARTSRMQRASGCDRLVDSMSSVLAAPSSVRGGRVQYAALPHPLAVIPGTKQAAAAAASKAAASASVTSNLVCADANPPLLPAMQAKQSKEALQRKAT
jgi:hypothetical protein